MMPIHRLNTPPTHHAVLGDITCDSDGKIDQFIDRRDVKRTLPLHTVNGEPYYLGVFLVGAYQEILGDLHNLFGDTHAVHVSLDEQRQRRARRGDQGRHGQGSARLRRVRRRHAGPQAAHTTSSSPCAKGGSATRSQAGSSSSTRRACRVTPTSKIPKSADVGTRDQEPEWQALPSDTDPGSSPALRAAAVLSNACVSSAAIISRCVSSIWLRSIM